MLKFLITEENFVQQTEAYLITTTGISTIMDCHRKSITLTINSMAPFAIYVWRQGAHYAVTNKLDLLAEHIAKFGCELTYTHVKALNESKPFVNRARDCNVEKITQWRQVKISAEGVVKVTKLPKPPYTVPLTSQRGIKILLKWLKKYLVITQKLIQRNQLIPCLTGGLDTRTLTWFWRDKYRGKEYYLIGVKPDGTNDPVKGQTEIKYAEAVLQRLGLPLKRVETVPEYCVNLSGMFTEHGCFAAQFNNPAFLYDFVAYHFSRSEDEMFYSSYNLWPFVDNLYLSLQHPKTYYMRTLLAELLCPDLLDIDLLSYYDRPSYSFKREFADLIVEVEQFIEKNHLRDRVAKIKAQVLQRYHK